MFSNKMLAPGEQMEGKIGVFIDIKLYYVCVGLDRGMRVIQLMKDEKWKM